MHGRESGPAAGPKPRTDSAPTSAEEVTEGQIVRREDPVPKRALSQAESDPQIALLRRFQPGMMISGRYRLDRMIARGGMGCVFLATQVPLGRQVAIKFLTVQEPTREFRRRFLLEASTCARLVHRHIVTVHDYGETPEGELYMAMEHLNGEPLSKVITKSVRFGGERACRVALQVCRALRAAHAAGVVHRDLKPSNVMLLRDEDEDVHAGGDFVKVLDFGLVKALETDEAEKERPEKLDLTRAGVLLGSPRYMAPEQIRSEAVTPATDVYSLGVILFHMLAGRPPFIGANSVEILNQHLKDPPPEIAAVAPDAEPVPELEVIIRRCMEKSPSDRYASMEELIVDLKAAYRLIAGLSFGTEALRDGALDEGAAELLSNVLRPNDADRSPEPRRTSEVSARSENTVADATPSKGPPAAPAPESVQRSEAGVSRPALAGVKRPPRLQSALLADAPEPPRSSRAGLVVLAGVAVLVAAFFVVRALQPPAPAHTSTPREQAGGAPAGATTTEPSVKEASAKEASAKAASATEVPSAGEDGARSNAVRVETNAREETNAVREATNAVREETNAVREETNAGRASAPAVRATAAKSREPRRAEVTRAEVKPADAKVTDAKVTNGKVTDAKVSEVKTTDAASGARATDVKRPGSEVRTVDDARSSNVVDRTRVVPVVDEPVPVVR